MRRKLSKVASLALVGALMAGCNQGTGTTQTTANQAQETTTQSEAATNETTAQEETTNTPETEQVETEPIEVETTTSDIVDTAKATVHEQAAVAVDDTVLDNPSDEEFGLTFSHDTGCYAGAFSLSIEAKEGKTIYYTLDGSDPRYSDNLYVYDGEIVVYDRVGEPNVVSAVNPDLFDTAHGEYDRKTGATSSYINPPSDDAVDKCMVVRAISVGDDGRSEGVVSKTYFIGDITDHVQGIVESCEAAGETLAIVSIAIDYDYLFDYETGIYVKGASFDESTADMISAAVANNQKIDPEEFRKMLANYSQRGRAWEREANITIIESDGVTTTGVVSQQAGIRIQGNYSRSDVLKGFRLYARNDYGDKRFRYAIFGDDLTDENGEVIDTFKTLVLRNGGNGAFANKFADTYWQSMIGDLDVSTKASRPAVVYINGEYWGLYILEEDYAEEYFEDHYNVDSNDVVLYKGDAETYALGYKLDLGDLPEGETEVEYYFSDLIEFFDTHEDCASQEDYDALCAIVDPESVRDYFAVEVWVNNKWDWPGKNWSMWKNLSENDTNVYNDGRWRFCVYDIEFGGVSGSGDATTNTIKEDNYKKRGLLDKGTTNPAVLCFAYMMTNEGFRQDYYSKLLGLSDNEFEYNHAIEVLDTFDAIYAPLYDQFFARYEGCGDADNARYGGYFSVKCLRDFLAKRYNNIQKMIDWSEKILG